MKLIRYVCTHCGRKFEAEEKEVQECPGCFWSTSVKREEDVRPSDKLPAEDKTVRPSFQFKFPSLNWKPWAVGFAAILVLLVLFKIVKSVPQKILQVSTKSSTAKQPPPAALSPEEQNILARRVQVSAGRGPSEAEQKILSNHISFKTGISEKLPSQAWTLQNFKDMIAQQEKFYKVPLPHSYKNKLYDLFKAKYVPGAEAFAAGDLLKARNQWVESLAFPLYSTNLQKHRGVALTMLRPFISDTLSKIGTINSAAVEKGIRIREQEIGIAYEKTIALIQQKSWKEALAGIDAVRQQLQSFSEPKKIAGNPEPYPPGLRQVDQDIQITLMELLQVPPPAVADLEPMKRDLEAKAKVVQSFIPENLGAVQAKYDEAVEKIAGKNWAEAERLLKEIDLPLELAQDASEKIKVLEKIQKPGLQPRPNQDTLNAGVGHETNRQSSK